MQISSKTAASLDELLAAASNEKVLRIIVTLVNRKIPTSTLPPASFPSATGKGIAIEHRQGLRRLRSALALAQ
jgi:hypothetical protein